MTASVRQTHPNRQFKEKLEKFARFFNYETELLGNTKIFSNFASSIYLSGMNTKDLIIPLNGLTSGRYELEGLLDKEFFKEFDNQDILDADLDIRIEVVKSGASSIYVTCDVEGEVTVACDRCLEPLAMPVDFVRNLTVKFGDDSRSSDGEEEVVMLESTDCDLDMSQYIYDYVILSLPIRKVHDEGECNSEMVQILESGISHSNSETAANNPFAALKDLFGQDK